MKSKVMMMAVLTMCGCGEMSEDCSFQEHEMVELSFSVPRQSMTRLSGAVSEDAVNDLQIFVFGLDGQLQAYGHSDTDELTLTCSTGDKRVAALVNSPLKEDVTDEASLKRLVSSFSDNSVTDFVMSGLVDTKVTRTESVVVPVNRLVSKIILKSVRNEFELPQHREIEFSVKSVFITNAPKDMGYFAHMPPSGWYNKDVSDMGQIIAQSGTMMYEDLGLKKLPYGEAYEPKTFFYCYPNDLADNAAPTYLVVEAMFGNSLYYYPVDLPAMESNKCYSVSLTVCRPGSDSPDIPVEKTDARFEVSVQPWADNVSVDEVI